MDKRTLKRRLDLFLGENKNEPSARLREAIFQVLLPLGPVAVVGGLARDLALRTSIHFKSDVDFAIDASPKSVATLAERVGAKRNRLGGYSYATAQYKLDFWCLQETWAKKAGLRPVDSFDDLLSCTFFDCDAVLYTLPSRSLKLQNGYLQRLESRELDINLAETPDALGNLLRASRRVISWNMNPQQRLRDFISANLTATTLRLMAEREARKHSYPIVSTFKAPEHLQSVLFDAEQRHRYRISFSEQLRFGFPV